jgi:hypothetical protein
VNEEELFAQYQQNVTLLLSLMLGLVFCPVKRYQHVCHTFNSRKNPKQAEQERKGKAAQKKKCFRNEKQD